jgi:hypothetical protein
MRETSNAAYQAIKASGLLSSRREQAYDITYEHGPGTAGELRKKSGVDGLWKRLTELRDMGLVYEVQERQCAVTDKVVIEWDTTNCFAPKKLVKAPAALRPLDQLFAFIKEEHNSLPKGDERRKALKSVVAKAKDLGVL